MNKKLILFKSPTCGPCKMFEPQLKKLAEQINAEYTFIDVTTELGLDYASKNGVTHSGEAWLMIDNDIKIRWNRPCAVEKLLADVKNIGVN